MPFCARRTRSVCRWPRQRTWLCDSARRTRNRCRLATAPSPDRLGTEMRDCCRAPGRWRRTQRALCDRYLRASLHGCPERPSRLTGGARIRLFVSVEDVDNRLPKRGAFGSAEKLLTPLYASRRRRRTPAREAISARTLTSLAAALSASSQGEVSMASSLPPPSRRVSSSRELPALMACLDSRLRGAEWNARPMLARRRAWPAQRAALRRPPTRRARRSARIQTTSIRARCVRSHGGRAALFARGAEPPRCGPAGPARTAHERGIRPAGLGQGMRVIPSCLFVRTLTASTARNRQVALHASAAGLPQGPQPRSPSSVSPAAQKNDLRAMAPCTALAFRPAWSPTSMRTRLMSLLTTRVRRVILRGLLSEAGASQTACRLTR
jgi:hypothetical protein